MRNLTLLNAIWFGTLLLVHFLDRKVLSIALLVGIVLLAIYGLVRPFVDPLAWLFYLLFSLIAYWVGYKFKGWVFGQSIRLQTEIDQYSLTMAERKKKLDNKTAISDFKNQRANDIHYLYDKMKDMSKSRDKFEAFLIFSEAYSQQVAFEKVSLSLFSEEDQGLKTAKEIYEFKKKDFDGFFDRNA